MVHVIYLCTLKCEKLLNEHLKEKMIIQHLIKYVLFDMGVGLESTKWNRYVRIDMFNCWAAIHVHAGAIVGLPISRFLSILIQMEMDKI